MEAGPLSALRLTDFQPKARAINWEGCEEGGVGASACPAIKVGPEC